MDVVPLQSTLGDLRQPPHPETPDHFGQEKPRAPVFWGLQP